MTPTEGMIVFWLLGSLVFDSALRSHGFVRAIKFATAAVLLVNAVLHLSRTVIE